jgi:hypothetical protein
MQVCAWLPELQREDLPAARVFEPNNAHKFHGASVLPVITCRYVQDCNRPLCAGRCLLLTVFSFILKFPLLVQWASRGRGSKTIQHKGPFKSNGSENQNGYQQRSEELR